jgi:hypothetical protein
MKRRTVSGLAVARARRRGLSAQHEQRENLERHGRPGFTIHLTMNGKRVTSLVAGSYAFVIADKASIHNFTLEQEAGGKFEKDLTLEDRIAHVSAPDGQALALTFLEVAAAHDGPACVAVENAPAGLDLIVGVGEPSETRERAEDLHELRLSSGRRRQPRSLD